MRKSVLHLFMISVFGLVTLQPAISLNAAELWNAPKFGGGNSGGSLYNKGTSNSKTEGGYTLYNRKDFGYSGRSNFEAYGGLDSSVQAYKKMKIAREVKQSKLWDLMDRSAIAGRQADINLSLQREYDTRIRLRAMSLQAAKSRQAYARAGQKRHKERMSVIENAKYAKRVKAWKNKMRNLQPNAALDDDYYYNGKGRKRIVLKKKKNLKKPTKLYNSSKY